MPPVFSAKWKRDRARDYMRRRRERIIQHLGGSCARCGATRRLEVDHIDPSTKSFEVMMSASSAWSRLVAELTKCQLLCARCHKAKTYRERNGYRDAARRARDGKAAKRTRVA